MRLLGDGDEAGVPLGGDAQRAAGAEKHAAERRDVSRRGARAVGRLEAARVRATPGVERVHTRIGYKHRDRLITYPDAPNLSGCA